MGALTRCNFRVLYRKVIIVKVYLPTASLRQMVSGSMEALL